MIKRKLATYLLALISTNLMLAQYSTKVYYVELKDGQEISSNPLKEYQSPKEAAARRITSLRLYPEITFQTMEGVGGAFNENGGQALMTLSESDRNEVMKNLFAEDNLCFTYCRTAVGASDFGLDAYSYSEVKDDYKMKSFSIERERTSVIPYLQLAYKYNPSLNLFASPWSPPGWMKESGTMDKGEDNKELCKLIQDPKIYKAYALYLSKYIKAYADEGIKVDRLVVQNEQDAITPYPSNYMPSSEMGPFVIDYLKPRFKKDKIKSEIWAGSFRTAVKADMLEFASNDDWMEAVDGIGIQYTSGEHILDFKMLRPNAKLFHTEGHCHNGKNTNGQAFSRFDEIASLINYGVPNYCYWNMILNETTKSGWDWAQNSLINIDRDQKTVTYNPDYAAISLFSKFIRPGMKRIGSHVRRGRTMTFVDAEGNITIFLKNDGDKAATYDLKLDEDKSEIINIPAKSLSVVKLLKNN